MNYITPLMTLAIFIYIFKNTNIISSLLKLPSQTLDSIKDLSSIPLDEIEEVTRQTMARDAYKPIPSKSLSSFGNYLKNTTNMPQEKIDYFGQLRIWDPEKQLSGEIKRLYYEYLINESYNQIKEEN